LFISGRQAPPYAVVAFAAGHEPESGERDRRCRLSSQPIATEPGAQQVSVDVLRSVIVSISAAVSAMIGPGTPSEPAAHPFAYFSAELLDLSNWSLTLPTGEESDSDDVHQPALSRYAGAHFHLNGRNAVITLTPSLRWSSIRCR
jgi:hypothetical protein